jgi:hypothetical protein
MRSSACAPGASLGPASASASFRRAASCRPATPATASTPQPLHNHTNALAGAVLAESLSSLPRARVVSCSLAAAPSGSAMAVPVHAAAAGSSCCAPAAASRCAHPWPAAIAAGLDLSAASAAAPVPPSHTFGSQLGTASPFPTPAAALPHHAQSVGNAITRADGSTRKHVAQPSPQAVSNKLSPKCGARRLGRAAAAAAAVTAVMLLFSVAGAAARHVAVSDNVGGWSTAALSQARYIVAATSLPNAGVAIFAGGQGTCCCCDCLSCCRMGLGARGMHELEECCVLMTCASLMPCAGGGGFPNVVDIFNVTAGTWSTAALSQGRQFLAATSLPNAGVAIFAGGFGTCCCDCLSCCRMGLGARGMHELEEYGVLMTCASLMPCSVGSQVPSNVVDIFNVAAGTLSTAVLSQARFLLAATSLPNAGVAIFAGGQGSFCYVCLSCCRMGFGCEGDA